MRPDRYDLLGLLGIGLLGAGLWLWWPAGALMVVGGLLLGLAILGAWRGKRG
jgi:hypothetical protein